MEIALGTVQFGLSYGISNTRGAVSGEEVGQILQEGHRRGVRVLDTAFLYGRSEEVLGETLPENLDFRVITKTPHFKTPGISADSEMELRDSFYESLRRLKRPKAAGLLLHQADDLFKPGGERLWKTLLSLKESGLVEKVGLSVYSPEQTRALPAGVKPDLIQLPMNFLDQRFLVSGELERLHSEGTEIHVRSAFLQGLLFMAPEGLSDYFSPVKEHLKRLQEDLKQRDVSVHEAAIAWMDSLGTVDALVLGVSSLEEWHELLAAAESKAENRLKLGDAWKDWRWDDPAILIPSRWPPK